MESNLSILIRTYGEIAIAAHPYVSMGQPFVVHVCTRKDLWLGVGVLFCLYGCLCFDPFYMFWDVYIFVL